MKWGIWGGGFRNGKGKGGGERGKGLTGVEPPRTSPLKPKPGLRGPPVGALLLYFYFSTSTPQTTRRPDRWNSRFLLPALRSASE